MVKPNPNNGLEAWMTLLETHSVVLDALERQLDAARGIGVGWYEVLIYLADAPGGRMRMQDLAGSVLLSKSGVTRLIDRLQERGLVERAACAEDKRVTYAAITPEGRSLLAETTPIHLAGVEEYFASHLNTEELRTLRDLLRKVLIANGRAGRTCPSVTQQPV
ncbi:MAG: MarR family winged helix-turn-helix transcriptional regulator [Actinomycetota bacterium]|nr:MarR family transcriptional regulator [Actinomycetota bacterium]